MVSPPGVRGGGQRLHGFQDVGALHLQVYKDQERSADFSGTGLHRALHRYVDHPGSKVADSQSGLSAHQSLLTPRCPFMRSMHQLCWLVNNSANGYSFRPYRGGWRSLAKPVALAHQTGGNPPNRWRICGRGRSSGTELGARRLKGRTMRFILAAILALSGLKLIVLWPRISQILLAAVSKHCEDGVCNSKMAILDDILGGT